MEPIKTIKGIAVPIQRLDVDMPGPHPRPLSNGRGVTHCGREW
jgi:hypothetical protein